MSDNALGAFLRARREAVRPADVGLPGGPRRRTPGLRRSELATLAGVSVEYLARLEQGRYRHPSAQVMAALADALRMTSDERHHLYRLSKASTGAGCPAAEPPAHTVRASVRELLDRLEPEPAILINRLTDVLAATTGYERLAAPLGILDDAPANLMRYVFTDPRAHAAYPDWDRVADHQVACLRAYYGRPDDHLAALVDAVSILAGDPFTGRMSAAPTVPQAARLERVMHPEVGELRLNQETFVSPGGDEHRLVVYLPADEATSLALRRLTGRQPGNLHAVTG
jgi:transcriptional regulator with XRE-family HTH domain